MRYDEDSKTDYFEGSYLPEEEEKKQEKGPVYRPEDPEYWEQPESEWEHLRPAPRSMPWIWIAVAAVGVGLIIGIWIHWFSPYVSDAVQYGYIEHIEKRGDVIKTFEGVILPYRQLMDTTRIYREDFVFSAKNDKVAADLKRYYIAHRPVKVEYKRYHATLPWRGASKTVVVKVDSVCADSILPPEYRLVFDP